MVKESHEKLLLKREVLTRIGHSNSTFYLRIKEGKIKPGVPIGVRGRRWLESEIDEYILSCIQARDAKGGAK